MCGIVGYIGTKPSRTYVVEGLKRLEYRGYDSAGFACLSLGDKRLRHAKAEGLVINLATKLTNDAIDGSPGIGHTRWSTHGIVSADNAHPHFDCHHKIALVHNGIIENYVQHKERLTGTGHKFSSQTDTETIAHLFESLLASGASVNDALLQLAQQLEGAFALALLMQDAPDTLIAMRKRSPLCIGIGNQEMFIASDMLAFAGYTNKVVFLPDESYALISADKIQLFNFMGTALPLSVKEVNLQWNDDGKQGYEHYMLKEIYEQKRVVQDTVRGYTNLGKDIWAQMGLSADIIGEIRAMHLLGCGTSYNAGRIAQFFFETVAQIPTQVHLASEFRYAPFFPDSKGIYLAISQSGETADTLEAVRLAARKSLATVTLTNVPSSTMVRECKGFLLTHAGPEFAVASTKAFSAQITALFWLAYYMAVEKQLITKKNLLAAEQDLLLVAEIMEHSLEQYKYDIINKLAPYYANFKHFIFLGRSISYPFALEAALKLKEISYIFVDSYPAGELKHGPLALIDKQAPIFLFSSLGPVYQKLVDAAQEIKARSGHLVVFAFEGQRELIGLADYAFIFPKVNPLLGPLAMTPTMQFTAYQIAAVLGRPIDKPRNLAKSVTVE